MTTVLRGIRHLVDPIEPIRVLIGARLCANSEDKDCYNVLYYCVRIGEKPDTIVNFFRMPEE